MARAKRRRVNTGRIDAALTSAACAGAIKVLSLFYLNSRVGMRSIVSTGL